MISYSPGPDGPETPKDIAVQSRSAGRTKRTEKVLPVVVTSFLGFWMVLSLQHGGLFFREVVICSLIIIGSLALQPGASRN